ncbi:MAG: succinate dehydrogenase assembly factor 2 [Gammaproteobacteria bacterium]|nr:succinate dehydrogenase assembly factor 2 [Gammaproteobacteria bacterium]
MDKYETLSALKWQCRRGMLELDVFLQKFLQHGYNDLDEREREDFYQILEYPDQELVELLLGQVSATEQHINEIADKIRQCAAL